MDSNKKKICKHKYIIGYSFRLPNPFFRSLPCDFCGCSIRLSLPWRIIYWCVDFIGYIFAFAISTSIHIKLLGNTLFISILVFLLLIWIVNTLVGIVFKYGKWIEVYKK